MESDPDLGFGFLLGALHRRLRAEWAQRLRGLNLAPPAALALRILHRHPGASLREVARMAGSEPINMSKVLERLEKTGLVSMEPSTRDRRANSYQLTEHGDQLLLHVEEAMVGFDEWLHASIGSVDIGTLKSSLMELLQALPPHPNS